MHLARNTTIIVITPTDQTDWISAARDVCHRGLKAIAVLIDPHSFGNPRGVRDLLAELAMSDIPTYLVREGEDLALSWRRLSPKRPRWHRGPRPVRSGAGLPHGRKSGTAAVC